jgi:hypothetical protein
MVRLAGAALRLPAPPVRPALAGSILCLSLLSLLPSSASAKHDSHAPTPETGTTTTPAAEAPAQPATTPASQPSETHKHGRHASPEAPPTGGQAPAVSSSPETATPTGKPDRTPHHGARRHHGDATEGASEGTSSTTPAATSTESKAGAQAKSEQSRKEREREREREQRRKEREARKEEAGHRETRKERLTREAEEARRREDHKAPAPEPMPAPVPVASVANAAPASGVSGTAPSSSESSLPGVIGQSAVASSGGVRGHNSPRSHRGTGSSATTGQLGALAAPASSGLVSVATRKTGARTARPAKHAKLSAQKHSELVRTVTKIIGVIPLGLWLLIGALAALAGAFGVSGRLTARRARRLAHQRRDLLEDVGLLQAALLPELPARIGLVGTTAAYRPASGPAAGGDFYDVFALGDGRVALIVGDVSGHGRSALPHTTLLRFTLRAYLEAGLSPRESLRTAAPVLERQLDGSFATVVLATYDPRERLLTYSCAGHPHPIVTGLEGAPNTCCSAPPVGAGQLTGTRQTVVSIPGGAVACFYTDGVIESRVQGDLFGEDRLAASLAGLGSSPSASGLLDRVSEEADSRPDDMAACLLGVEGSGARPRIALEELELSSRELERDRVRRFLTAAGVPDEEIDPVLSSARELLAREGRALLKIHLDEGSPSVTLTHDNVASLTARSIARSQEVAL